MMPPPPQRIVLTGFSGTGKSVVAALVAERLGWRAVDTDLLVENVAGKAITEIFERWGESHFRDLEAQAVREACGWEQAVVSTGGGAILRPGNRLLLAEGGFIVCLEARPETILQRLREGVDDEPLDRPLLTVDDPLGRVRKLKAARQPLYSLADSTIHTDGLTAEEVAAEVVRDWRRHAIVVMGAPDRLEAISAPPPATDAAAPPPPEAAGLVRTATASYPVLVEWGVLAELGSLMRDAGLTSQAYVISDETVFDHYGGQVEASLSKAGIPVAAYTVAPGESTKTLDTASAIYDWLIERRAERGHAVVALGGGMVTDLAGFVAATFARGLPLVHVPTSLLAMVDAAVGGKVAVNHPQSKNAIGAFYQPRFVLADPATLRSLPERDHSGWAEAIKHALILDRELLSFFEEQAARILRLEPEPTTEAIGRSVAIKARIVSEDEREETGRRTLLNYGHTVGHAVEAVTGYQRYRHGEADAIGMTAAAAIGRRLGLLTREAEQRQRGLLERFNLPTSADGLDRAQVLAATALDKKVRGGAVCWVLLEDVGGPAVIRDDVPPAVVEEALAEVLT